MRDTRPDDIGVSLSYPLPGTTFFEKVQQQLGDKRNWADSDDLCTIYTAAYKDAFYHSLRDALHAEVNAGFSSTVHEASEALWRRVHALEPVSRNLDVPLLCHHDDPSFVPLSSVVTQPRSF